MARLRQRRAILGIGVLSGFLLGCGVEGSAQGPRKQGKGGEVFGPVCHLELLADRSALPASPLRDCEDEDERASQGDLPAVRGEQCVVGTAMGVLVRGADGPVLFTVAHPFFDEARLPLPYGKDPADGLEDGGGALQNNGERGALVPSSQGGSDEVDAELAGTQGEAFREAIVAAVRSTALRLRCAIRLRRRAQDCNGGRWLFLDMDEQRVLTLPLDSEYLPLFAEWMRAMWIGDEAGVDALDLLPFPLPAQMLPATATLRMARIERYSEDLGSPFLVAGRPIGDDVQAPQRSPLPAMPPWSDEPSSSRESGHGSAELALVQSFAQSRQEGYAPSSPQSAARDRYDMRLFGGDTWQRRPGSAGAPVFSASVLWQMMHRQNEDLFAIDPGAFVGMLGRPFARSGGALGASSMSRFAVPPPGAPGFVPAGTGPAESVVHVADLAIASRVQKMLPQPL